MTKQTNKQTKTKPMPIRWGVLLSILPQYDWIVSKAAQDENVGYTEQYATKRLPAILKRDVGFCRALEAKKAEIQAITGYDVVKSTEEMRIIREGAKAEKQFSAAVRAEELIGRMHGIYERDNSQKAAVTLAAALGGMLRAGLQQPERKAIESTQVENCTENYNTTYKTDEETDNLDNDTSITSE